MAVAETAKLIVDLSLTGNYKSGLASAQRSFNTLGRSITDTQGRAYKAGQQIGTGIKRGVYLAIAGITTLVGVLAYSVKQGQEAARVQEVYATSIRNSGKISAAYVAALNDQQIALLKLTGIDDELIKTEQTRLIQMGLTGKQTLALTPAIVDLSKATGKDLLTATIAVGKAANGNATSLQKFGVFVDKAKFKVDPFAATLEALTKKFKGVSQATSGDLTTRIAVFRELLNNVAEDAGQKLLPVLTKIVTIAGEKLVPAFGKFIDRILPAVIDGLNQFSDLLSNGGAEKGLNAITDALIPLVNLVKIAAAPVKAIVGAFLSLPSQVQTVLIGAFAVNKLTGGLVTNVFGGIAEAIAKSFIRAPLVNVQGGIVKVGGAISGGGLPSGGTGVAAKGLGLLSKVFLVGETIGLVAAVADVWKNVNDASSQQASDIQATQKQFIANQPNKRDLTTALAGVEQGIHDLEFNPLNVLVQGDALEKLRQMRADLQAALARQGGGEKFGPPTTLTGKGLPSNLAKTQDIESLRGTIAGKLSADIAASDRTAAATTAAGRRNEAAARLAAAAIRAKDFSVHITVPVKVSAVNMTKTLVINRRYGVATGSAYNRAPDHGPLIY